MRGLPSFDSFTHPPVSPRIAKHHFSDQGENGGITGSAYLGSSIMALRILRRAAFSLRLRVSLGFS